jgi:hypothetical protein
VLFVCDAVRIGVFFFFRANFSSRFSPNFSGRECEQISGYAFLYALSNLDSGIAFVLFFTAHLDFLPFLDIVYYVLLSIARIQAPST